MRSRERSSPWIHRNGKLGGKGFLSKPVSTQHSLLTKCVREYGYRSCLGSVMVLSRNRSIQRSHSAKINSLKNWLKKKYGGSGTFGKKSRSRSTRRRSTRKSHRRRS